MVQDPNWGTEHIPDNVDTGHAVANTTLDEIIQGVSDPFNVNLTSGNVAFTTDDEYVLNFVFQLTGHSVARDVTIFSAKKKYATWDNQGTGIVSVKLGTATVVIEVGEIATLYSDGTVNNLVKIGSNFAQDTSLSGVITETGTTHTPDITQANKYILYTNAAAVTVTIPPNSTQAFIIGTILSFEQNNTGQITVVEGSGVTVNVPASFVRSTFERFSTIAVTKVAINTWTIIGHLASS